MTPAACSKSGKGLDHLDCELCELLEIKSSDKLNPDDKKFYMWIFLTELHSRHGNVIKLVTEWKPFERRGSKRRLGTDAQQPGDNSSYLPFDYCVHTFNGHEINLLVEIDGVQHVNKPMFGRSVADQQAVDGAKDALVLSHGRRLLRLHYNDVTYTNKWFMRAVNECRNGRSFVMYSYSYNREMRYV
jgi:hypothetical protein